MTLPNVVNRTPPRQLTAFPQTLKLRGRGWLPPLSDLWASPLTRNRRLVLSQHDVLNPPTDDTIRDAILTCARKPTWVGLIYRTEPTTKNCKNREKTKSRRQICSEITVNSLGNPCSESWRGKRNGCGGKDLQKRKVLSLEWKSEWVMECQIIASMTVGR